MKNDVLISVVVPVYGTEKYLDVCVESLVRQTYGRLEIILVDDGSPDACPAICDRWAEQDKRIKVIHKKNGGLSDARNCGLKETNGEYVIFIDSDDWVEENMLEVLLSNALEHGVDIVNCQFVGESDRRKSTKLAPRYPSMLKTGREGLLLLNKDKIVTNHVWRNLFRKELLRDIAFPKGKNFEDIHVMHEIFFKSQKILFIGDVLYHYFINPDGIVKNKNEKNSRDYLEAWMRREAFLQENMPEALEEYRKHMFRCFYSEWRYAKKHYGAGDGEGYSVRSATESFLVDVPLQYVRFKKLPQVIFLKLRHYFKR